MISSFLMPFELQYLLHEIEQLTVNRLWNKHIAIALDLAASIGPMSTYHLCVDSSFCLRSRGDGSPV